MKIVLIVGTGASGSSAICDFLTNSTKYKNPFKGQEFRIIDDPDGILNIYNNFYINHSINNPSNAIMRFKNYIENLINLKVKIDNKQNNVYDKKILSITDKYIKNITTLSYCAYPQFIEIQTSLFKKKFLNFKKKFFPSKDGGNLFKMYLPVKKEIFLKHSKNYLRKIIELHSQNKKINHIVLDQSLNMWNFKEIFSYFDDVKIILVTRDPRSIFNSMKNRSAKAYPGYDLKIWTKWYELIMYKFVNYKKKIPKKYKKYILEIKFEDFCQNYESEQNKVLNFLNTKKVNDNFDIKNSKFNVFKAKKELSVFEKNYIKKKLSKYLQW
jgi:hypothetical protein